MCIKIAPQITPLDAMINVEGAIKAGAVHLSPGKTILDPGL
jgi:hypothetical protein